MIVRALLVSLLIGTLSACRDHVDPFSANARPDLGDAGVRRLTRSIGNDRAPRWSSDGRTLVYAAEGFEPFQKSRGVLIRIGRDGEEPARSAVPALQSPEGTRRWFVSPTLSADGERLAFAEMIGVSRESPCRGTPICEAEGRVYEPGQPTLTVISLAGEEPIELGSGVEPRTESSPSMKLPT